MSETPRPLGALSPGWGVGTGRAGSPWARSQPPGPATPTRACPQSLPGSFTRKAVCSLVSHSPGGLDTKEPHVGSGASGTRAGRARSRPSRYELPHAPAPGPGQCSASAPASSAVKQGREQAPRAGAKVTERRRQPSYRRGPDSPLLGTGAGGPAGGPPGTGGETPTQPNSEGPSSVPHSQPGTLPTSRWGSGSPRTGR